MAWVSLSVSGAGAHEQNICTFLTANQNTRSLLDLQEEKKFSLKFEIMSRAYTLIDEIDQFPNHSWCIISFLNFWD